MRSLDTVHMSGSGADVRAPFARIVCGASGTHSSRVAVEHALEAAGVDGTVRFLAISDVSGIGPDLMAGTGTARAERALADARQAARDAGVAATTELCHHADPRRVLVETAHASDLLVLGGHVHSRGEGLFLGSAAVYALHAATVPVLVARPMPAGRRLPERVMVAAAGAEGDRHSAQVAAALAVRGGGSLTFLHVARPYGSDVQRHLAQATADAIAITGTEPIVVTVRGHGPDALVAVADELEATLLVLGSRSLSGLRALASVCERVGARARCPVLVLVMRDQASADARFASCNSG
jgi:nucleotide-binding universal stress UspA family protein